MTNSEIIDTKKKLNTALGQWHKMDQLQGKTFSKIEGMEEGSKEVIFYNEEDVASYKMFHYQDCCESVYLCTVDGDVEDLIGCEIIEADCVCSEYEPDDNGLAAYTFYKFRTKKGYVTLRWNGESNGWYSVDVEIEELC